MQQKNYSDKKPVLPKEVVSSPKIKVYCVTKRSRNKAEWYATEKLYSSNRNFTKAITVDSLGSEKSTFQSQYESMNSRLPNQSRNYLGISQTNTLEDDQVKRMYNTQNTLDSLDYTQKTDRNGPSKGRARVKLLTIDLQSDGMVGSPPKTTQPNTERKKSYKTSFHNMFSHLQT